MAQRDFILNFQGGFHVEKEKLGVTKNGEDIIISRGYVPELKKKLGIKK